MLSIIIPAFNQHEMTAACIEAVRRHTSDYELVVVDNGSQPPIDGAAIRNESNLGFPAAVNQGIVAAKGDIIVLLNNDVIVTPGALNRLGAWADIGFDIVGDPDAATLLAGSQTEINFLPAARPKRFIEGAYLFKQ